MPRSEYVERRLAEIGRQPVSPYKKAVDRFKASGDWEVGSDPTTLRAPSEMRQYLENRLLRAFEAGYRAGSRADRDNDA